ncbi:hypothetical protein EH227_18180 [Rouxiella chamberiensis]|jgi:hypothetical protein|uniref:hypothetical protein n=1 Tax=Rahnella sp. ChDrAdgB13 TaxID=1850581 RepID=UPI001265DBBF|nr:hypothetical protein [Rahnella sp. ChDrAdgB13]KAB8306888.1 hypothetical protein EH227_18180 [Rouxiella chamberiensis]
MERFGKEKTETGTQRYFLTAIHGKDRTTTDSFLRLDCDSQHDRLFRCFAVVNDFEENGRQRSQSALFLWLYVSL